MILSLSYFLIMTGLSRVFKCIFYAQFDKIAGLLYLLYMLMLHFHVWIGMPDVWKMSDWFLKISDLLSVNYIILSPYAEMCEHPCKLVQYRFKGVLCVNWVRNLFTGLQEMFRPSPLYTVRLVSYMIGKLWAACMLCKWWGHRNKG